MPDRRPERSEYADFYSGYVSHVPEGPILETLRSQREEHHAFCLSIDESLADHRYAPGKWTVRELLGHVLDAERVFAFRAIHIARNGGGALPGMDQDDFVAAAPYGNRTLASITQELHLLRGANLLQFEAFDAAIMDRRGLASGVAFSVRALLHIIAGHNRHHMQVLRDRYLQG